MPGAVHRHVTLTLEEDERLRQRAREQGISEEDLLRDAVRQMLGGAAIEDVPENHESAQREWTEIKALMRARATLPVLPEDQSRGRGWTREEIYDERYDITAR
jgi:plasmid stability protein